VADAAPGLAGGSFSGAEGVLRTLADDPEPEVRETVAAALSRLVDGAPAADRFEIVSRWSLSERVSERRAAARVLASCAPAFGDVAILAHLAGDAHREVRRNALQAVRARFAQDRPVLEATAVPALRDPDRKVRRMARRLLARAV
jgi:hypothetical protein